MPSARPVRPWLKSAPNWRRDGIENALGRLEAAQQRYQAWTELDQAIIDIQEAVHDRKNTLAVQQILTELVGTILGSALRTGMH